MYDRVLFLLFIQSFLCMAVISFYHAMKHEYYSCRFISMCVYERSVLSPYKHCTTVHCFFCSYVRFVCMVVISYYHVFRHYGCRFLCLCVYEHSILTSYKHHICVFSCFCAYHMCMFCDISTHICVSYIQICILSCVHNIF